MKTRRHRWHPFNPRCVRLFLAKASSQWHRLRQEAAIHDGGQSSAIIATAAPHRLRWLSSS